MASLEEVIRKLRQRAEAQAKRGPKKTKGGKEAADRAGMAAVNLFESTAPIGGLAAGSIFAAPGAQSVLGAMTGKGRVGGAAQAEGFMSGRAMGRGGMRTPSTSPFAINPRELGRTMSKPSSPFAINPRALGRTMASGGSSFSGVTPGMELVKAPTTTAPGAQASGLRGAWNFMKDVNTGKRGFTSRIPGLSGSSFGAGASGLGRLGAGVTRFGAPAAALSASHGMITELQNPSFSQLVDQNRATGVAQTMGVGAARSLGVDRLLNLGLPGTGPVVRGRADEPMGRGSKIQTDAELRRAEQKVTFGTGTDLDTNEQVAKFKQEKTKELQARGITDPVEQMAHIAVALNNEMAASQEKGQGASYALSQATREMNASLTQEQRNMIPRIQAGAATGAGVPLGTEAPAPTGGVPQPQPQSFIDFSPDEIDALARQVIGSPDSQLQNIRQRQEEVLSQSQAVTAEELGMLPGFREEGEQRVLGIAQGVSDTAAAEQRQRQADIAASQAALGPGVDIGAGTLQGGAGIAGDQAAGQVLGEEMTKLNESAANNMELLSKARQGRFEDDLKLTALTMEGQVLQSYNESVNALKQTILLSQMETSQAMALKQWEAQQEAALNASEPMTSDQINRINQVLDNTARVDIYDVNGTTVPVPAGGAPPKGFGENSGITLQSQGVLQYSDWPTLYTAMTQNGVPTPDALRYLGQYLGHGNIMSEVAMLGIQYDPNSQQLIDMQSGAPASGELIQSLYSASAMGVIQPEVEAQVDQATR